MPATQPLPVRLALLVGTGILALTAGACSGSTDDGGTTATQQPPATVAPEPTDPAPTTTAPPTTGAPTTSAPAAERLVLQRGAIADLPFGTPKETVVAELSARIGPPAERGDGIDAVCPSYTWVSWKTPDLSTYYDEDGLVGWTTSSHEVGATPEGISVGSTVADLRQAFGSELVIRESTLGHQFYVNVGEDASPTFVGLVDSTEATGKVIHLWSGFTCTAH